MPAIHKQPVDGRRIRRMPRQFGAVDRKLVYAELIRRLTPLEAALYVVLICVADPEGLSYYSDRRLAELLGVGREPLVAAREGLLRKGFILYDRPIYQLLDLPSDS